MATYTSNYAWAKPSGSDPVDISVLNGNLDSQDGIIHDAFLNMAAPFSESSTYAVGDIVLYGTKTYRCRVAVTTAGSWTGATNWDEYKLSELTDEIATKVDKVTGKGLSTNDYTNTDKAEVAKVANKADKTATATGETLSLVPTSEGRVLIHTAYGMSTQSGTPTPSSPVDIVSAKADFRSVGKNLIPLPYYYQKENGNPWTSTSGVTYTVNNDGTITLNGTSSFTGLGYRLIGGSDLASKDLLLPIKPNTKYIITGTPLEAGSGADYISRLYYTVYSADTVTAIQQGGVYSEGVQINTPSNAGYIRIVIDIKKNAIYNNLTFKPMLCLADVEDSTYEPYHKSDMTTDLTLRAIEVTSSDAYNLVRDGKYYIADTLDYSEDNGFVVTRRVGALTFDGSDDTNFTIASNYVSSNKRLIYNNAIIPSYQDLGYSNAWHKGSINSNFLPECIASANQPYNSVETIGLHLSNHNIQLYIAGKSSVADYMAAFVSNPLNMIYRLATPTTEAITTAQALALLGLKTYDESTTISSQAEPSCTIAVEYAKERLGALALTAYNTAKGNDLRITALEG